MPENNGTGSGVLPIDLEQVEVRGAHPRVLGFSVTTAIRELTLRPGGMRVVLEEAAIAHWPVVSVGGGAAPNQAATLWVFLYIGGRWFATGAERLKPEQILGETKPEDGTVDDFIARNWLYDLNRWGPMTGYVPRAGEPVGFMVAAGSTRSDDNTPVEERSPVWVIAWPGADGQEDIVPIWVEGDGVPDPPDPPQPGEPTWVFTAAQADEFMAQVRRAFDAIGKKHA